MEGSAHTLVKKVKPISGQNKIWCPYKKDTKKDVKRKREEKINNEKSSQLTGESENDSHETEKTVKVLQSYFIPEVSESNVVQPVNLYQKRGDKPVWNSADHFNSQNQSKKSYSQQMYLNQSFQSLSDSKGPSNSHSSSGEMEQLTCQFSMEIQPNPALSSCENSQGHIIDTLSNENVNIHQPVRGRSNVSSTSTCSWNSIDSMRNEVETPMLEDLDEFCDLNIESLLQDNVDDKQDTIEDIKKDDNVDEDTSDKDEEEDDNDDSSVSSDEDEEEDIVELEEDVDSSESTKPEAEKKKAEKRKSYSLPSFDGN